MNMDLGFHPDFGLPNELRVKAIADAERIGIAAAAELNKVTKQSIYAWRKRAAQISQSDRDAA
jgi:transposase-like protein